MMNPPVEKCIPGKASNGFTLIDLITTIAILGILAGISIPTMTTYLFKAQLASLETTLDHLMDGEDLCFFGNDTFHPENGSINIPKGVKKEIPEIAYTFPKGHNHHYMIYGYNQSGRSWKYNYYYIYVRSDFDFNRNGSKDIFIVITYYYNGRTLYHRKIYHYV